MKELKLHYLSERRLRGDMLTDDEHLHGKKIQGAKRLFNTREKVKTRTRKNHLRNKAYIMNGEGG